MVRRLFWNDLENRLRIGWRLPFFLPLLAIALIAVAPFLQIVKLILLVAVTWLIRRYIDRRDLSSLGLSFYKGWSRDALLGLGLGGLLMSMIFIVELACGWIDVSGFAWEVHRFDVFLARFFWNALVAMLVVAFSEEIIMRGYLLQTLEEGFGTRPAVLVSSTFFGVLHLINPTAEGWATYVIPFTLTLAGIMFTFAYLVRHSLWLPITLHFAWNLFEYDLFGLTGATADHATFLITKLTGPAVWVGLPDSAFGPEVGLLGFGAMILGIVLLSLMAKRGNKHTATRGPIKTKVVSSKA